MAKKTKKAAKKSKPRAASKSRKGRIQTDAVPRLNDPNRFAASLIDRVIEATK